MTAAASARIVSTYARQAIETRYHGPTNTRGARISARASAGRIFVPYDHARDAFENHVSAALAFANKFAWSGEWTAGGTADGYVFVQIVRD